jgi:hypothetical protein
VYVLYLSLQIKLWSINGNNSGSTVSSVCASAVAGNGSDCLAPHPNAAQCLASGVGTSIKVMDLDKMSCALG